MNAQFSKMMGLILMILSTSVTTATANDDSIRLNAYAKIKSSPREECLKISNTFSVLAPQFVLFDIYDYLNDHADEYHQHEVPISIAIRNFCDADLRIWSPDHSVYFTSAKRQGESDGEDGMHERWISHYHGDEERTHSISLDRNNKPIRRTLAQMLRLYFTSEDFVENPQATLQWELVSTDEASSRSKTISSGTLTINLSVVEDPLQE